MFAVPQLIPPVNGRDRIATRMRLRSYAAHSYSSLAISLGMVREVHIGTDHMVLDAHPGFHPVVIRSVDRDGKWIISLVSIRHPELEVPLLRYGPKAAQLLYPEVVHKYEHLIPRRTKPCS